MGLFKKKELCCICNKNDGIKTLSIGVICKQCINNCGPFLGIFELKNSSPNRVHEAIAVNSINNERLHIFNADKSIQKYIEIDETNKFLRFPHFLPTVIFTYSEILDYELLQNGETISKGSLGNAIIGGMLLGNIGVVGGIAGKKNIEQEITEYKIKITTKNSFCPIVYIDFLSTGKVKANSLLFKSYAGNAQEILSQLTIIASQTTTSPVLLQNNAADEILKFKNLLDQGIITQDEFNAKKKQLLGI